MSEPIKVTVRARKQSMQRGGHDAWGGPTNETERHSGFVTILSEQGDEGSMVKMKSPKYSYEYPIHTPTHDDEGNLTLFNATEPTKPVVDVMGSSKGGSGTVPTALGAAIQESRKRWGVDPVASDDLSTDSAKLVGKLKDTGADVGLDDVEATNDYGSNDGEVWFENARDSINHRKVVGPQSGIETLNEYSPEEVASAQRTMREALRKPRTAPVNDNVSREQLTQGELF